MDIEVLIPFLKFFDEQYINIDDIKSFKDLQKLPIYAFKFFEKNDSKIISKIFDINVIEDLSKLNRENPFEKLFSLESTKDPIKQAKVVEEMKQQIESLKEKIPDFEKKLKKGIIISEIIVRTAKKKSIEKKKETKIVCVGLDNAGKTAILSKFGDRLGIQELMNIEPTKKIERQSVETDTLTLWIWDFGGQKTYRDIYLEEPEKYFLQTDLLIYVIDVQDTTKYDETFEYFEDILQILKTLEEKPYVLVFIHKSDPDLREEPEFQLNIELLKDRVGDLFETYKFENDIYITSIYNLISSEPKFSRYLKDILKEQQSLSDPTLKRVEGIGQILDRTLNAIIRLSESLTSRLDELDIRLASIEHGIQSGGILVPPPPPGAKEEEIKEESSRAAVLNELKELFHKRKTLKY